MIFIVRSIVFRPNSKYSFRFSIKDHTGTSDICHASRILFVNVINISYLLFWNSVVSIFSTSSTRVWAPRWCSFSVKLASRTYHWYFGMNVRQQSTSDSNRDLPIISFSLKLLFLSHSIETTPRELIIKSIGLSFVIKKEDETIRIFSSCISLRIIISQNAVSISI